MNCDPCGLSICILLGLSRGSQLPGGAKIAWFLNPIAVTTNFLGYWVTLRVAGLRWALR